MSIKQCAIWYGSALGLVIAVVPAINVAQQVQSATQRTSYVSEEIPSQNGDPNALEKATFHYFLDIVAKEKFRPGSAVSGFRQSIKLDELVATDYLRFIQKAVATYDRFNRDRVQVQCLNRSNLATPQVLATELTAADQDLERLQIELVRQSEDALGPANKKLVDDYVANRMLDGLRVYKTDHLQFMEETGKEPEAILSSICNTTSEQTTR